MARDFESFIVDPSLLDPSIDATDLRTTTDTRQELLSDVPDYAGIQFDPTRTSYLDDLYALYSGGLPMFDTAQIPGAVDTLVDAGGGGGDGGTIGTGSGGQATGGGLTQSGTFGGQPTFTTTPGTTVDDITGDITNPDGTYGGNIVDEVALTGGTTTPVDNTINIEGTETITAPTYEGDVTYQTPINQTTPDFKQIQDLPMVQTSTDAQGDIYSMREEDYGSYLGNINDEVALTGTGTPETESALSQAFRTGKEALDSGMQTISQVGQSIADSVKGTYNDLNKTVEVPGLGEISIRDTLAGLAVNTLVGAPVSFVKYAMGQLPKSTSQLAYEGYTPEQQAAVDEVFGPNGSMVGYNAVSAFGTTPAETIQNRIDNIKNRKAPQTDASKKQIEKLETDLEKITGETINAGKTVDEKIDEGIEEAEADKELEDIGTEAITADDAFKETGDYDGPSVHTDPIGPQFNDPGYADPGVDAEENQTGPYDGYDDFDDGTMTGDTADSVDDVLGPMPDTPAAPPSNPNAREGAAEDGGNNVGGTGTAAARDTSQGETGYGSCFIAGTKISMADGTLKNIEDVIVGDKVKGHKEENTVIKLDPTLLGDRKLYSFNNNKHHFFTSEHPFMTEEGWKSIKPEKTKERDGVELYEQLKGELKVGDKLVTDNNSIEITNIDSKEMNNPEMPLYNFNVSNDNSYIADSYVVHNKGGGGGGGCVIATHAVNSGAFTKDTKREAVRWCVKNLHRTWWGEAVRKGYRYYGQKAIEEGNAKNHYQEFKDYVAFGTGKKRTLKTGWTFVYRTVQFFLRGLIL